VAAGVEVEPWKYRWSSARAHALGETDQLVTESHEYLALSADAEQRQALWRDFLMGPDARFSCDVYFRRASPFFPELVAGRSLALAGDHRGAG
jgi:hypothetical protein